MADIVEIIISAIDEASPVFGQIANEVSEMASEVDSAVDSVDADKLADEFKEVDHAIDNVDSNSLDKVGKEVQEDKSKFTQLKETITNTFESAKGKVTGFGSTLQEMGGKVTGLGGKFQELKNSINYAGASFGFLRDAVSMTVGMLAYDLFNSIMEAGRAAINAAGQLEYFAGRLNMSQEQISSFNSYLEQMQQQFRKVNMKAVGAAAEEMAVKLGLPISALQELTETTAVLSSAFVKEGRTQEDAILAVSDALDGQFRRLQELGITQQDLINNGWSGDLQDKEGLLKALNKTLDEMGFTDTAKDITSLEDAFQALSVAGGDLMATVLIPITPYLVAIMEAAIAAMDGIKGAISGLVSAGSGMPDWALIAAGVTAVGVAMVLLGMYIQATVIPGFIGAASSAVAWVASALGVNVANMTLTASFSAVASAVWAALAPLLPFIAAAAVVVVAIYEIGKAFGWWTDVGSMLEAIWAGLQRLWSAFINHPDVQALIKGISDAWNWLTEAIGQAWQMVTGFLGVFKADGEFDIVRAIIDGVGFAFQVMTVPIRAAITYLQWLFSVYAQLYAILQPIGAYILDLLGPSFQALANIIGTVISEVQKVIDVFNQFMSGQADLGDLVGTILSAVWNIWSSFMTNLGAIWWNVLNTIGQLIWDFVTNMPIWAAQAGMWFLQALWNWIQQVPPMILNFLVQAAMNINTTMLRWVSEGRAKAISFVMGIINYIRTLPQRVWDWLLATLSKIIAAGKEWVDNAKQKAKELVDGVIDKITGLPGRIADAMAGVKDALVKPFQEAWDAIKPLMGMIGNAGSGNGAAGGDLPLAAGGDIAPITGNVSSSVAGYTLSQSEPIEINQNLTLDFKNVPSHISTEQLVSVLTDPKVLRELTGNRDFQLLDGRAKEKWNLKYNRARGV